MDIAHLASANKTIGAKQTMKAIKRGEIKSVFIGYDSDDYVVAPVRNACVEYGIPYNEEHTMNDLGRACHIKVKATAVGILR